MGKNIETGNFFVGGEGMFIQYHDILKPVYLYAVMKMIITNETFGVPVNIIEDFSIASIIEWYKNRRYKNPIQQLDIEHKTDESILNQILSQVLSNDSSIYKLAPPLNIERMFSVYRSQHLSFPVFVYSENYEPGIEEDIKSILTGVDYKYVYGDLEECIKKCDQNFTYIFSDIELVKSAANILHGTYSHVLLARDYRYNYIDNYKNFKYNLEDLMRKHPFIRLGTTTAMDIGLLDDAFDNISEADYDIPDIEGDEDEEEETDEITYDFFDVDEDGFDDEDDL